ncbi:hypothetical protein ASG74_12270 [Knoellia sp. Soil729]|nr:hypothetical protein ASG74_12270 [Knoellia sp. Soil729]
MTTTVTATATASSSAAPTTHQFPPKPPSKAKTVTLHSFVTPSGNIRCTDEVGGLLSCLVDKTDFPTPERPRDCAEDWAEGEISFSPPRTTLGSCRGDPPPAALHPDAPTFEYGTVNQLKGGVRCLSEEQGLTCWTPGTGHGFFVSRSVFAVF